MTASSGSASAAGGPVSAPARFTLAEDGKWTLSCSGRRPVRPAGSVKRLILEGKMTEGDPMSVGRTVSLIMKLQGADFL